MKLLELHTEEKNPVFQVKVGNDGWKDISLGKGISLEEIQKSVSGHPSGEYKFDISVLTGLVEEYIGDGPNGYGPAAGTWDEMDFEVASFGDDVLKIKYEFSGMDRHHDVRKKSGVITIMAT